MSREKPQRLKEALRIIEEAKGNNSKYIESYLTSLKKQLNHLTPQATNFYLGFLKK